MFINIYVIYDYIAYSVCSCLSLAEWYVAVVASKLNITPLSNCFKTPWCAHSSSFFTPTTFTMFTPSRSTFYLLCLILLSCSSCCCLAQEAKKKRKGKSKSAKCPKRTIKKGKKGKKFFKNGYADQNENENGLFSVPSCQARDLEGCTPFVRLCDLHCDHNAIFAILSLYTILFNDQVPKTLLVQINRFVNFIKPHSNRIFSVAFIKTEPTSRYRPPGHQKRQGARTIL